MQNYKNFKKAKLISDDLETIEAIIRSSMKLFYRYRKYKPVQDILHDLEGHKTVVNVYTKKYKQIIQQKGLPNERT